MLASLSAPDRRPAACPLGGPRPTPWYHCRTPPAETRDTAPRPDVVLRPLQPDDTDALLRIHRTPEVAHWWDEPDDGFPFDEPESTRLTILLDGVVVGLVQHYEETEPKYRHAGIDVFVDPAVHGQGVGTEAVRQVVRLLVEEHGHHRVVIDPATANVAAIRAYEKAGFRAVGVMRQSERDADGGGWHDVLLMELLAADWV